MLLFVLWVFFGYVTELIQTSIHRIQDFFFLSIISIFVILYFPDIIRIKYVYSYLINKKYLNKEIKTVFKSLAMPLWILSWPSKWASCYIRYCLPRLVKIMSAFRRCNGWDIIMPSSEPDRKQANSISGYHLQGCHYPVAWCIVISFGYYLSISSDFLVTKWTVVYWCNHRPFVSIAIIKKGVWKAWGKSSHFWKKQLT